MGHHGNRSQWRQLYRCSGSDGLNGTASKGRCFPRCHHSVASLDHQFFVFGGSVGRDTRHNEQNDLWIISVEMNGSDNVDVTYEVKRPDDFETKPCLRPAANLPDASEGSGPAGPKPQLLTVGAIEQDSPPNSEARELPLRVWPARRSGASLVADPKRRKLLLFGGYIPDALLTLRGRQRVAEPELDGLPAELADVDTEQSPQRIRRPKGVYSNELWSYDLDKEDWTLLGPDAGNTQKDELLSEEAQEASGIAKPSAVAWPRGRAAHTACLMGDEMVIFGGISKAMHSGRNGTPAARDERFFNDVWLWSMGSQTWRCVWDCHPKRGAAASLSPDTESSNPESPNDVRPNSNDMRPNSNDMRPNSNDMRPNSNDVRPNSNDVRPNSNDVRPNSNDVRPNSNAARPSDMTGPFLTPRSLHAACIYKHFLVVICGHDGSGACFDFWLFDFLRNSWKPQSLSFCWNQMDLPGIPERYSHGATLFGATVIVFGGERCYGSPCWDSWAINLQTWTAHPMARREGLSDGGGCQEAFLQLSVEDDRPDCDWCHSMQPQGDDEGEALGQTGIPRRTVEGREGRFFDEAYSSLKDHQLVRVVPKNGLGRQLIGVVGGQYPISTLRCLDRGFGFGGCRAAEALEEAEMDDAEAARLEMQLPGLSIVDPQSGHFQVWQKILKLSERPLRKDRLDSEMTLFCRVFFEVCISVGTRVLAFL